MPSVHLLDYVAGNVRSLVNAINKVGYDVKWIKFPEEICNAEVRFLVVDEQDDDTFPIKEST